MSDNTKALWNKVCEEARALAGGRGIGDLLAAVGALAQQAATPTLTDEQIERARLETADHYAISKLAAFAFVRHLLAAAPTPAAQAGDAWISVEDRLPEPDAGEVLVWLTGGRCAFDEWHMHSEDPTGMGGPTMEMGCMWRDYDFEEVTHWQRLPDAPRAALKGQPEGHA